MALAKVAELRVKSSGTYSGNDKLVLLPSHWDHIYGKPTSYTPAPHTHTKSEVGLDKVQNYGIAAQSAAEAGVSNAVYMTPLRTKQAIRSYLSYESIPGTWQQIYNGDSTSLDSGIRAIDLSNPDFSVSNGDTIAIEVRYGNSNATTYSNQIVLLTLGSSSSYSSSATYPRKVSLSDFDGEYFKIIGFKVYGSNGNLYVGRLSFLRGRFLSSSSIDWHTNQSLNVYIGKIWKLG